ncbi:hypothetical protein [Tenacibaculum retecalamus]|uniref:hypothetical protein n=1 Tax=Tenacibaculum retecalamus TaxID=3018315 RepID=UPI0023D94403|nr:hypothetical protein [Tenacibaculum retecalamus]WBX72119.1 hypothetical protein PG912_04960 [Tenacibaculum retecalamus]
MKNLKALLICFSVFAFMSCSDDDVNRAPREFTVTLSDVSSRTSSPTPVRYLGVIWTEAVDPDGDDVVYDIYVNDVIEESDLNGKREATVSYEVTGDDVIVKVVAKDENGAKTTAQATKVVNVIHP